LPGEELDPDAAGEPAGAPAGDVAPGVAAVPAVSEPVAAAPEPPVVTVLASVWPAGAGAAALSLTPDFWPQAAATSRTSSRAAQRM
jgi:hypothetical protein